VVRSERHGGCGVVMEVGSESYLWQLQVSRGVRGGTAKIGFSFLLFVAASAVSASSGARLGGSGEDVRHRLGFAPLGILQACRCVGVVLLEAGFAEVTWAGEVGGAQKAQNLD
jgi:hypothetical protein